MVHLVDDRRDSDKGSLHTHETDPLRRIDCVVSWVRRAVGPDAQPSQSAAVRATPGVGRRPLNPRFGKAPHAITALYDISRRNHLSQRWRYFPKDALQERRSAFRMGGLIPFLRAQPSEAHDCSLQGQTSNASELQHHPDCDSVASTTTLRCSGNRATTC